MTALLRQIRHSFQRDMSTSLAAVFVMALGIGSVNALLLGGFAIQALVIASAGLFGLLAHSAVIRRRELARDTCRDWSEAGPGRVDAAASSDLATLFGVALTFALVAVAAMLLRSCAQAGPIRRMC